MTKKESGGRSSWTAQEDEVLKRLIAELGAHTWNRIAKLLAKAIHPLPPRTAKSCRLRWCNQLDDRLKLGPLTKEEEEQICALVTEKGKKWSEIAKLIPGRSDNMIKNYWYSRFGKRGRTIPSSRSKAGGGRGGGSSTRKRHAEDDSDLDSDEDEELGSSEGGDSSSDSEGDWEPRALRSKAQRRSPGAAGGSAAGGGAGGVAGTSSAAGVGPTKATSSSAAPGVPGGQVQVGARATGHASAEQEASMASEHMPGRTGMMMAAAAGIAAAAGVGLGMAMQQQHQQHQQMGSGKLAGMDASLGMAAAQSQQRQPHHQQQMAGPQLGSEGNLSMGAAHSQQQQWQLQQPQQLLSGGQLSAGGSPWQAGKHNQQQHQMPDSILMSSMLQQQQQQQVQQMSSAHGSSSNNTAGGLHAMHGYLAGGRGPAAAAAALASTLAYGSTSSGLMAMEHRMSTSSGLTSGLAPQGQQLTTTKRVVQSEPCIGMPNMGNFEHHLAQLGSSSGSGGYLGRAGAQAPGSNSLVAHLAGGGLSSSCTVVNSLMDQTHSIESLLNSLEASLNHGPKSLASGSATANLASALMDSQHMRPASIGGHAVSRLSLASGSGLGTSLSASAVGLTHAYQGLGSGLAMPQSSSGLELKEEQGYGGWLSADAPPTSLPQALAQHRSYALAQREGLAKQLLQAGKAMDPSWEVPGATRMLSAMGQHPAAAVGQQMAHSTLAQYHMRQQQQQQLQQQEQQQWQCQAQAQSGRSERRLGHDLACSLMGPSVKDEPMVGDGGGASGFFAGAEGPSSRQQPFAWGPFLEGPQGQQTAAAQSGPSVQLDLRFGMSGPGGSRLQ